MLLLLGSAVFILGLNLATHLQQKQLGFSFSFLQSQVGFKVSESLIPKNPQQTYLSALWVGLANALRISALGIVLATLIGVGMGVARLSSN